MSTTMKLKLTGIASFIASVTQSQVMKRGQVAVFNYADAQKLLRSSRVDKEGEPLPYFKEMEEDAKEDFDFSTSAEDDADQSASTKQVISRQRKPAAAQPNA